MKMMGRLPYKRDLRNSTQEIRDGVLDYFNTISDKINHPGEVHNALLNLVVKNMAAYVVAGGMSMKDAEDMIDNMTLSMKRDLAEQVKVLYGRANKQSRKRRRNH